MAEIVLVPADDANTAFDNYSSPILEIPSIPGFNNPFKDVEPRNLEDGVIPSLFIITRMSDGKQFATEFNESPGKRSWTESPFSADRDDDMIEFFEVELQERTVIEQNFVRVV